MSRRHKFALWLLFALAISVPANAQGLLPNARQTFIDSNGLPLVGGTVQFYIPSTTTPKTTWSDAALTQPNPNPITLDSAGSASIYGQGQYRQVVRTILGTLVWDSITQAPSLSSAYAVATNTALQAICTAVSGCPSGNQIISSGVWRQDYATGNGAPPLFYSASNIACPLNGGNGDNGSQVKSADNKCWLAKFDNQADLREWGAVATAAGSSDAGPAIRAAAAYSAANGVTISVPAPATPGNSFWLTSLDGSGLGALVTGLTASIGGQRTTPNFVGQAWYNSPDQCSWMPMFTLGNGLNRPLVYSKNNSTNSYFGKLCLNGNRGGQAGWVGGPGGKLYTIQIEDFNATNPESAVVLDKVVVLQGYNGNIYHGGFRGLLYGNDLWVMYSGQTTSDQALYLNSYDAFFTNLQVGVNTGTGVYFAEGEDYIIYGGGSFLNNLGMFVAGQQVIDLQVNNFRLQDNQCGGIQIPHVTPLAGTNPGGHAYNSLVFHNNSQSGNGLCSDVFAANATIDAFANPVFIGSLATGGNKPQYNFDVSSGGNIIQVNGATTGSGNPFTSAFASDFTQLRGDYLFIPTWTPNFIGQATAGTNTPTVQVGTWNRHGKEVTVNANFNATSLSGATGNALLGPLPFLSSSNIANSNGGCSTSSHKGWTGASGYTSLGGIINANSPYIQLVENGSGKDEQPSDIGTEWASTVIIQISCTYPTDQ